MIFPSSSKEYTYLVPKDHGLEVGSKVQTPTGPAHVSRRNPPSLVSLAYKALVGKYVLEKFKYD